MLDDLYNIYFILGDDDDFMEMLKLGKKYIAKHKWIFLLYFTLQIFIWAFGMLSPYISGLYIDQLIINKDLSVIYYFSILMLILGVLTASMYYVSNVSLVKLQTLCGFELNYDILEHVKRLPLMFFNNTNTSYLNQRINADANTVVIFVANNSTSFVTNCLSIVFSLAILTYTNLKLTFILITLIPIYIVLYVKFRKPLFDKGYKLKEEQSRFFSLMNDQLANIRLIKLNSSFEFLGGKLLHSFKSLLDAVNSKSRVTYLFSCSDNFIRSLSMIILFFFGGFEIINGRLTIGQFTIVGSYFSSIMSCTNYFLNFGQSYQDALVSYKRIVEIQETKKEQNGDVKLDKIKSIEANNIDFSYVESQKILSNINLKFERGKLYCIRGENGAGKSTFINLMMGLFIGSHEGSVKYNSVDIEELDMYHIRNKLTGITEQEPSLMNDTIISNIKHGHDNISDSEINSWLDKLNMSTFLEKQSNGIHTNLHNSKNVSGGEKQKISLTRVLSKNPDVIILDEPTSALDAESILNLKDILNEIKKDKIVIMITHDKSLVDMSDEIISLEKYRVLEKQKIV